MAKSKTEKFDEYFKNLWGERWESLRHSLVQRERKKIKISSTLPDGSELVYSWGQLKAFVSEFSDEEFYELDLASLLAVVALQIQGEPRILDLCSAPGGKSLVSQFITGGMGEWVLNDVSPGRVKRLGMVMGKFSQLKKSQYKLFQRDASKWGMHESEAYDYVICDVPCSGEEYLLQSQKDVDEWKPKKSKSLAIRQHAILCSALEAVRPGGKILYSTCSVNPSENDGVIEKFLKKRGDRVEISSLSHVDFEFEKSQYGGQIFPDQFGMGPIYFCVIRRKL